MLVVSVISSRMLLLAALFFHPYSYLLQGASASIVKRVPHQRRLCPYSRNCTIVSWTAKIKSQKVRTKFDTVIAEQLRLVAK